MSIQIQASVIAAVLAVAAFSSVQAQDSAQKQANGRRIAMVLPKVSTQPVQIKAVPVVPAVTAVKKTEVESANAKQTGYSKNPASTQIPENVRAVLIDGAVKAEQLSRSYNRRIADLIVWIACSMNKSSNFTPAAAPYIRQQHSIEPQPLTPGERNPQAIFQID